MIVHALKSSVIGGPKIRAGVSAGLLTLSDELKNCCWAMIELQSNELDCTTNLRQTYDCLPGHLQENGESQPSCTVRGQVEESQH